MKQKNDSKLTMTPKWIVLKLTGILFAVYAAYTVFNIFKSSKPLSAQAKFISVLVALMFCVFSAYALTFGVKINNLIFLRIRRFSFVSALLVIFTLRLRMAGSVADYLDFSETHTVLYGCSYILTLAALAVIIVYYLFIHKRLMRFPKAYVRLPVLAAIMLLCGLILDAILYFGYGLVLEASPLRTMLIRPVFYLSFIGLSVSFLIRPKPPAKPKKNNNSDPADMQKTQNKSCPPN